MNTEEQVRKTNTALDVLLSEKPLQDKMKVFGFGKDVLLGGKSLCQQVNTLSALQQKEYGESYDATDVLTKAKEDAKSTYLRHLDIARLAFDQERGPWKTLQLGGKRKDSLFGWLGQAEIFYANVDPVADTLARYNLSVAEMQQGRAMIAAVKAAFEARRKEFNEAKLATKNKNKALSELKQWASAFTKVAEVALKDEPEALIRLGLKK